VGDEPGGVVTRVEHGELDALRGRAYAQDADIFDDAAAVARLRDLEDRLRVEHFSAPGEWTVEFSLAVLHARSLPAAPEPPPETSRGPVSPQGRRTTGRSPRPTWLRWHEALVAGTAALSVLLAAGAWIDADSRVAADTVETATAEELAPTSYAELYALHMESLREELLSGPGTAEIGARMLRGLLKPQGVLYGRAVGAGPTRDGEFCMIVADAPAPSIVCTSATDTESAVSVILPPAAVASSHRPKTSAPSVMYTLTADRGVVAEPIQPDAQ
jgi:hypothetical protein